jgi:EAL domain-containing protein (putative c-di-GMP-specific phosphodiesterase class I)
VLKPPFEVAGEELFVTGSIGIAVYPNDGADAQTLQKHADMALYRAKAQGRNGYQCFSQEMLAAVSERLALEGQLRRALEHGEFELRYQPQFDREMTLVGFEALLRWRHPKLGEVPPTKFIPLAEETGLILGIGDWVLDEACRQNRAWQRAGHPPIKVAVNVSAMQFAQPGFAESVARVLERHGLAPQWLELEITESLLMKNTQESSKKLEDIRRMGISVALDDFGTGYSSLAYLQHLPIDTLKIDRSFVQRIHDGAAPSNEVAVIRAILSMGHNLGMHVVAEGVESKFQFDFLRRHGCNGIQGFLFGKPRPASEAVRFFQHTSKPIVAPGNLPLSA